MLHIHNGDAAANIAKQTSLPGEHFAFREALIDGPTPAQFNGNDWRLVRARHLWSAYGVDLVECGKGLLAQEMKLASFAFHDEVVLWFEHDLFCQVHLIYLLDWFGRRQLGNTKLSLVCIGEFPGRENFRGLGELTSQEFASLFPARQQVTQGQLELATSAWDAYRSDDPSGIEKLDQTATSSLPFLRSALNAHLQRFPSTTNGLGRIENTALRLIAGGATRFSELFARFGAAEPGYGLGDAQFWLALRALNLVRHPLVAVEDSNGAAARLGKEIVSETTFEITETGKAVLRSEADFISLNGVEFWLGGVHFSGRKKTWRWDDENKTLILG